MKTRLIRIFVLFGFVFLAGIPVFTQDAPASTLVLTNYNGGEIEWVAIQGDNSAESKLAEYRTNIEYRDNKTVSIPLWAVGTETPFTGSGKFMIVLKHKGSPKHMYIKNKVAFTGGGANVRWGSWFRWGDDS